MKLDSSEEIANRYKQDTKRKKVNEDSIGDVQAKPRRRQIALQIGRRARVRQRVGKQQRGSRRLLQTDFVARSNVTVCMFHVLTIRSRLRCYLTAPPL